MGIGHFREKINLSLLDGAVTGNCLLGGRRKRCIIIPVADGKLHEDDRGVWVDLAGIRVANAFEHSHLLKQQLPREVLNGMTAEERKSLPVLGAVTPFCPNRDFIAPEVMDVKIVVGTVDDEEQDGWDEF